MSFFFFLLRSKITFILLNTTTEQKFSFRSVWSAWIFFGFTVYQDWLMFDTQLKTIWHILNLVCRLYDEKPQQLSFPESHHISITTQSPPEQRLHTDTLVLRYDNKVNALRVCDGGFGSLRYVCLLLYMIAFAFLCCLCRHFMSRYTCLYTCTSHWISLMLLRGLWWWLVWKIQ